ncbi:hypothetical protein Avbf_15172 [Armadillidium vulgare]|nr:hypothetical protein Avbf_15172 [Armadillidium vulgare]
MNVSRKRKYVNPYSRGAVLCKLAQRYIKGQEDDCESESASSAPPSLPSDFPEDLLDDSLEQCFSPKNLYSQENDKIYYNLQTSNTSFDSLLKTENEKFHIKTDDKKQTIKIERETFSVGCRSEKNCGYATPTFSDVNIPTQIYRANDFENDLSTLTEVTKISQKCTDSKDFHYTASISPQKFNKLKDHDYAPSTTSTSEGSISPEKFKGSKSNSTVRESNNVASSQNSAEYEIKKITVQNLQTCNFKSRKNYCPYCLKLQTQLPRHMINRHKIEKKVQEFMSYPKNSKERAILLEELRKLGNFKHNSFVINNEEGEILPTIRPKNEKNAGNYIPCRNCLGFYPKSFLWRHNSQCKKIHKPNLQSRRIVGHGMNLLLNAKSCSKQFLDNVVGPMNFDDINLVVRNDLLILKLGESMFMKNPEPWKYRYARNTMRELGRLLISLRSIDKSVTSLRDFIHPTKFQNIVQAAKEVAGFDGTSSFEHGSLVLKIGINIKKCAEILSGMCLDEGNEVLSTACECFIKRFDREWANNVSSLALRDLNQKKFNKPKYLPLVEDFQKLNKYVSAETKNSFNKLTNLQKNIELLNGSKTEIQTLWMNLMKLTLSSIILFNRRRSGEAERILICHYEKGLQASSSCPDLQKTLSPSEQMMSKYFKRIEIPGKRGNKVPNLRDFIGVNPDNKFLFPRPNNDSVNSISGSKTLQDIVKMADLKKPETMLSTNLRKHIATMSQVLNLSQPELEELCKLMGHDIRVHTFLLPLTR